MGRTVRTLAITAMVLIVAGPAMAATISVELNQSRRVILPGAAGTVVVGNPKVADVTVIDAHSIIVMGRGYGRTNVMVTDHNGRTLLDREVMVVSPEDGRVTVHHGLVTTDFSCAERCEPLAKDPAAGAP